MKGISPIVAAVLLIAITMTLAGALALWATKLVGEKLPSPETEVECKLANLDFLSCKYNSTTKNVTFTLTNRRNVELRNLTAFVYYTNGSVSTGVELNGTLKTGTEAIKTFSLTGVSSDFSSIIIKTHCPDVETSSSCTRS